MIVKVRSGASANAVTALEQIADADRSDRLANVRSGALWRLHSRSKNVQALITALEKNPNIEYVEPNYVLQLVATPNDPSFANLWGLKNTGQTISGSVGFAGSDINAEAAWNVTTGSASVVVGVVDTGIDYNHPDLAANVWSNPGGKGNVACAAGTHGFNAITRTCDPKDDHYHGTHVSGTIGAVGNNAVGVAGVNWTASIMGLKFLDSQGYGSTADAIAAIDFAVQAKIDGVNVRVLSNSWGGGPFSKALYDEINKASDNDILFVASAGNNSANNDTYPHYPSNYATPNMISVAATDNRDGLAYFSNIGPTTVHLGAPGVNVYSTTPNGLYGYLSGTSMAAPHVSGVAALILADSPALSTAQVRNAILSNTTAISSLNGKTVTGGRLNAAKALGVPPGPDFTLSVNPLTRSLVRGSTTTYTVTVNATNGFASAVDLSVTGLPSGVTGSFNPASTTTTSTLTLTATPSASLNTTQFTIAGTGGGVTRSTTATVSVVSTPPASACPAFATPSTYYSQSAVTVAIGDLNRDGRNDLVTALAGSNRVAIRLGSTGGGFGSSQEFSTGTTPISVAVGDFNRDGKADVVAANAGSNNISVLAGNGDGTLQPAAHYPAGTGPFAVATGDFNGDGKLDVAVANNGSDDVSILLGQGNGSFQNAVAYSVPSGAFALAVGDLSGDGQADLAIAAFSSGKVSVLLGNGDGSFGAATSYDAASGSSGVAIADFNRDGRNDLAVSNYNANNVSTLAGNNGTFQAAVQTTVGVAPYAIATSDFNGDGAADLVTVNNESGTLSLLIGNGAGGFQPPLNRIVPTEPNHVAAGDLNGDGRPDVAVTSDDYYYGISVVINTSVCSINCNTFAAAADRATGAGPAAVTSGDFDGDGRLDVASANEGANTISVALGNGDGTLDAAVSYAAGTNPRAIVVADWNRDGKLDAAVANNGSNDVSILIGNGDGTLQTATSVAAGTGPESLRAGDFDRDGRLDLVVANGGSNNVSVLLGNGNGTFQAAVSYAAGTTPVAVAVGDLNRDGRLDLAVANSGSNGFSIFAGNGDGTFPPATTVSMGTAPSAIVVADVNRDGKLDVAVANNGSNNVTVRLGNGDGTFQSGVAIGAGTAPAGLAEADVNDDGKLDLAVVNDGSNDVSILLGSGSGSFSAAGTMAAGLVPAAILAVDLNRDGKPDFVTANSGGASMSVLMNSCPTPDLTIAKTHTGNFTQGATGRTYTITVSNAGLAATDGSVVVTDTLPVGLYGAAMSGTGWACASTSCSRSDALAAGASYPPITLTVNVASSAPATVTNTVTVTGGGDINGTNNTATDPTTIDPVRDLLIAVTHTGNFTQGDTGRAYTIWVRNAGGLATAGVVAVADTLPAGLTATSLAGTGWSCVLGTLTCTRGDALAGGAAFPPITLTVDVAANAPPRVTNAATVSGGSDAITTNNTASDPTLIWSESSCGSFAAPVNHSAGSYTNAVAMADFNADGISDLAVANSSPSNVSILLGSGNGTFGAPVSYATGAWTYTVAAGDLNNDGKIDLVTGNIDSATVSVLIGNGNGTFATAVNYPLSSGGAAVIADVNGDGNADVLATQRYSSSVAVLLGTGNGTLQPSVSHVVGSYPQSLSPGDFNADGKVDIVVGRENGGVAMLLGNGDGSFTSAVSYPGGYYSISIAVADFNGDGRLDVVKANYYDYYLSLFLGNGDGTLAAATNVALTDRASDVVAEDINGDGSTDLTVASGAANVVLVLLGNGDGTFQAGTRYVAGNNPDDVVVGDFNSDGKADLAVANFYGGNVGIFLGGCPDLAITKTHNGNFAPGQSNATYTLTVSNVGTGGSLGTVTVTDVVPSGLTLTGMSGSGWVCSVANAQCTRSTSIANGTNSTITVTVNVSPTAPESVTNVATVAGAADTNSANNTANDLTTISAPADLTVSKVLNGGSFLHGQAARTYTITVSNFGAGTTSGTVTVVDTLPSGLIGVSMGGAGWTCPPTTWTCTRSDALASSLTYPPITVTVDVNANAPASVTNTATVSGGGEVATSNNTASVTTAVLGVPLNLTATAISTSQVALSWTVVGGAANYQVMRRSNGGAYTLIGIPVSNSFLDTSLNPNTTYVYEVRAADATAVGPPSNRDAATTMLFTDEPIVTGVAAPRPAHIAELRSAVNAIRAAAGLAPAVFTDPTITTGMLIKAVHLSQLRVWLDEARFVLELPPVVYGDSSIVPGVAVKAAHIRELRSGVK